MRVKAFIIPKNPKYVGYHPGLASMLYKYFDKNSTLISRPKTLATRDKSASGRAIKKENMSNKELAEELHKPIISKFKKRKVQWPFTDNIQGADLVDMVFISKFNKEVRFFLCVIDIFSKYAWII